jgi:hypothetical protein
MKDEKHGGLMTGRDILIVLAVIAAALILYSSFAKTKTASASYVNVFLGTGGEPTQHVPLNEDKTIRIDQGDGRVNVIEIKDSGVRMAYSTCINQDCVHEGVVTDESRKHRALGDWIVCLPNAVSIELVEGP